MTDDNELEYEDLDDAYYEDDDEYIEDESERETPFRKSSGSPFGSRAGSSSGSSPFSGSPFRNRPSSSSGSGSKGSSSSSSRRSSEGDSSRNRSSFYSRSSGSGSRSDSDRDSRSSSSSGRSRFSGTYGNSKDSRSSSSSGRSSSSNSSDRRSAFGSRSSSSSSSPFGGSRRSSSGDDDSRKSGSGLPGRRSSFSSSSSRSSTSKTSKPTSGDKSGEEDGDKGGGPLSATISSVRERFGSLGGDGEGGGLLSKLPFGGGGGDKDGKSKANNDSGGLLSKLPFGGDSDGESGGNPLSGLTGRLPFGGGDDDSKKPSKKSSKKDGEGGGFLSGLTSNLPFGGDDDSKKSSEKSSKKSSKKKDDGKSLGDRWNAFTSNISVPFTGEDKPSSKTVKARRKKSSSGEGLSLDRKLDILGVGLVIGSLALMLSVISQNQGVLTAGINNFFASLLGWGYFAVPITMFLVGMWLIVRHFGDDAPTIDTERLIGIGIIYVSFLVVLQFADAWTYENIFSLQDLQAATAETWQNPDLIPEGGGWVGGNLYLLMVQYLGEVFAFAIILFMLIVGIMLVLDVSVSEVAIIMIGLWRSFRVAQRRSAERKAVRRAERLAKRQEQVAALAAAEPNIDVSKPGNKALSSGSAGELPAPGDDRAIPITMGGRTVNAAMDGEQVAVDAGGEGKQATNGGGLLSFMPNFGGDDVNASKPGKGNDGNGNGNGNNGGSTLNSLMSALPFGGNGGNTPSAGAPPKPAAPPEAQSQTTAQPPQQQPANRAQSAQQSQPAPQPTQSPQQQQNRAQTQQPSGGQPAPKNTRATNAQDEVLENKRISQVMEAVQPKQGEQATDTSAQPTAEQARANRLDALRRGENQPPKPPEDTKPDETDNGSTSTPPKPDQQQQAASTSDTPKNGGNTDAYGNAPKRAEMKRPDEMKPPAEPGTVVDGKLQPQSPSQRDWDLPDIDELLNEGSDQDFDRQFLVEQARIIEETLKGFGAPGRVVEINTGPVITQYGVEPDYLQNRSGKRSRVKVGAIAALDRDLQLALGAKSIRIEAPVPGKGYVGIEIPNAENALVSLKDVMQSDPFQKKLKKSPLTIALGQSVDGTPVAADLSSMPHLLIAGTTGSGKSVCINSIICSLIANNTPEQLKLIMVDPKRVELTGYNSTPHLVAPVVVELERIVGVLKWVTREMDERYKRFSNAGARHIEDFNKHLRPGDEPMPYIVVIIDELADLMMLAPEETERTITRIAALARATGIHLVIATQRPSTDVVTGLIKANFPARIAFAVAGGVDSRVILDQPGAERLLGRGDMLYLSGDSPAPQRLQGVFVSDEEIDNITRYWKTQSVGIKPAPVRGMAPLSMDPSSSPRKMTPSAVNGAPDALNGVGGQASFLDEDDDDDEMEMEDELYGEAVELVQKLNKASVSLLQRRLRIGYTRASRLVDKMEEQGIVGPQESGSKPREVLTSD